MTTNVGYATLSVIPGLSGFQSSLTRGIDPTMNAAGKRAGSRFGSAFKGTLGAIGLFSAASGALRFLGDSVQEGREAVKVGAQTAAVIKSTSGAAKVTEKQVGRLAKQLSKMAGIDDEIIQGGANVLLTFKNIRNESGEGNKVFDKANKAALNLSVSLGKDLNSSALMVGKALNDPIAGMTALGRAGVQFSADQKEAIKRMVETGDTVGAQKAILRELNDQFRGSAKAQRTEADKLSVAFGDFKEEIGTALLPVLDDLAKFIRKKGIPRAREFFGFLRDEGVPAAKNIAKFAEKAAGKVKGLVDAFNGMPDWAKKVLAGGAIAGVVGKKLGVGSLIGGQNGILSKGGSPARPIYTFETNPAVVAGDGVGGVGKKGLSVASKSGLYGAAAVGFGYGVFEGSKSVQSNLKGFAATTRGMSFGGGTSTGPNDRTVDPKVQAYYDAQAKGQKVLQSEWDKTKARADLYFSLLKNNQDTKMRFTVTGWDIANRDAREYLSLLLQIRNAHTTGGFSGEGSTTPGQSPNHTPGGLTPAHGRGVSVNIYGDVKPNDSKEFFGDLQRRATAAALDGWRK